MARIVQGLRCMVNQSFMVARVAGPRNILQNRSMHYGLSSMATGGLMAPSLIKTVQVHNPIPKQIFHSTIQILCCCCYNCLLYSLRFPIDKIIRAVFEARKHNELCAHVIRIFLVRLFTSNSIQAFVSNRLQEIQIVQEKWLNFGNVSYAFFWIPKSQKMLLFLSPYHFIGSEIFIA